METITDMSEHPGMARGGGSLWQARRASFERRAAEMRARPDHQHNIRVRAAAIARWRGKKTTEPTDFPCPASHPGINS